MTLNQYFRAGAGVSFETGGYTGYRSDWNPGVHPASMLHYDLINSIGYMESYNHGRTAGQRYPGYDRGGPWLSEDIILSYNPVVLQQFGSVAQGGYGHCQQRAYTASTEVVSISKTSPPTTAALAKAKCESYTGPLDAAGMISKGSTAIARCEPTNPSTDLSTAIGELIRDGMPAMPGRAEGNIGDEYLNLQFGWSPTIADGRSFIQAVRDQDDVNKQYVLDSGKLVRRSYSFPVEESSSTVTQTAVYPAYWDGPTADVVGTGTRVTTTRTTKRTWFDGAFTYHLPGNAFGRTVATLDKKYGVLPGVDTAWNVMPYSWLVDWFSNAGDVVHNLNAFSQNGLVMAYGYVMQDKIVQTDCSWTGNLKDWNGVNHKYTLTDSVIKRIRGRVQATPYGFGLDWNGFSSFQLSILAALGISRGRYGQ